MTLSLIILQLLYASLLLGFIYVLRFNDDVPASKPSSINFSLIIAFKNESERLLPLLASLNELDYEKDQFEVLFVNDHSTDSGPAVIDGFGLNLNYRILSLPNEKQGKKKAISLGVKHAKFDHVLTTDADCLLPTDLLQTYSATFETSKADLIFGPVIYSYPSSLLQKFQYYDFLAIQAVSKVCGILSQPISCNAANLAYKKECFLRLKPYEDNTQIPSGDDYFLLQCFKQNNRKIAYARTSMPVLTQAETTLKGLINQRKRWYAKSTSHKSIGSFNLELILVLGHFNLVFSLVLFAFQLVPFSVVLGVIISKFLLEFLFLYAFSKPYSLKLCWRETIVISSVYPLIILLFLVMLFNKSYTWK